MSTLVEHHPLQLRTAYGVCRHITRSEAKNFYYGFLVLPRRKRNALSAVYAFMRHADDVADDVSVPVAERRAKLNKFRDDYRRVASGASTDDPVFMALRDSQQRFQIPLDLLEQLVAGTCMDLNQAKSHVVPGSAENPVVAYRTFAELYDYCYHVASVVGLICIRIFGYRDPAAEPLAEHVGIAFQLTNILRDIKEDAQMGRIYLPREDLDRFGISAQELATGANPEKLRPLFDLEAKRARDFYKAAEQLIPLVEEESQGALWAMVEIYSRLLSKIQLRNYDVFKERIRVPTIEKLSILSKGIVRRFT